MTVGFGKTLAPAGLVVSLGKLDQVVEPGDEASSWLRDLRGPEPETLPEETEPEHKPSLLGHSFRALGVTAC